MITYGWMHACMHGQLKNRMPSAANRPWRHKTNLNCGIPWWRHKQIFPHGQLGNSIIMSQQHVHRPSIL